MFFFCPDGIIKLPIARGGGSKSNGNAKLLPSKNHLFSFTLHHLAIIIISFCYPPFLCFSAANFE
jgi:hypothetical protein